MHTRVLLFPLLTACHSSFVLTETEGTTVSQASVTTSSGATETIATGSTGSTVIGATETTETTGSAETSDTTDAWDGARLEILSPASGDFLPLGEAAMFAAQVTDPDGEPLDQDDITWSCDLDADWSGEGAEFDDDTLDIGTYAFTAETVLPSGDRLATTIGGVRVQHENAGTYAGLMMVDMITTYDKVDYTATCLGAATLVVDAAGEIAEGDSACTLSLMGYDIESDYLFDFELAEEEVGGEALIDFWSIYELPFEVSGEVGDGLLVADWADTIWIGLDIELVGDLELERITRETGDE